MKNVTTQLGLIGCGGLGRMHLQTHGGKYAPNDSRRIFEDSGIDAVYICTLHDSHAPLAIAAAMGA